jgi:hypothetical protein
MNSTGRYGLALCGLIFCTGTLVAADVRAEVTPAKLQPIPFTRVTIRDGFWAPRRETNRVSSIPTNFKMLEKAGNIRNLELAADGARSGYSGPVFMDSDLYKALEAASYSLATDPDPALDKQVDDVIAKIVAAQQPDGYLNTHFQVNAPDKKWTNLRDWHELYCAGHLFEAATAHYQATGKRTLLDVAMKFADNIGSVFGNGPGKRMGYPGHPEIELALIKLWKITGEQRFFDLARFFVENRGRRFFAEEHKTPTNQYDGAYWQDDIPIREHRNIKGHAVRACYLLSGATDAAAETGDAGLLRMINRVWRNTATRNTYLTGGIGPSAHNEGFTEDYDLPNLTAYQETCATIALAQWNHRLALLYGDAKYADVVERALYNGVLSGVSEDGTKFFYVNPLASRGQHHRSPWFGCACCPPNVARTLASLGNYAYATSERALYVNLYIQGSAEATLLGHKVRLDVQTDYPWNGKVVLKPLLDSPAEWELRLRLPVWCHEASVKVNRQRISEPLIDRGYLVLSRRWRTGDRVELDLPMEVQRVAAHPSVKANIGYQALQRGPLVYCLEACDHSEPLESLSLPATAPLEAVKESQKGRPVMVLKGSAEAVGDLDWTGKLYQTASSVRTVPIRAIPYYHWDNREPGAMQVWMPLAPLHAFVQSLERQAKVAVSFRNDNSQPEGIHDGVEPKNSGEQPEALCHWWPHQGTEEWVQYTWKKAVTIGGVRVYWFDDTGRGACRLPASWQLDCLVGQNWIPVPASTAQATRKDQWNQIVFDPVTTTSLRMRVRLQPQWAAGVHELKILSPEELE